MMASSSSLSIRCRANQILSNPPNSPHQPSSIAISNHANSQTRKGRISITTPSIPKTRSTRINLDDWMKESVVEIVKNLREAPLFVNVYSKRLETEKAEAENWAVLKEKWEKGDSPVPEGIIFVEELNEDDGNEEKTDFSESEGITRAWGVVVQRRGLECGPACYLLKTSRVGSELGCTHFCLMRVKSFKQTAESQLKDCWLCQEQ